MSRREVKRQIVAALILAALAAGFFLIPYIGSPNVHFVAPDITTPEGVSRGHQFWMGEIERLGGTEAYAEFLQAYANLTLPQQHAAGHLFGEALSERVGIDGLAVCDSSFQYGCFHSLFGYVIQAQGLSGIAALGQKCFETFDAVNVVGCNHGIGHGIQLYLGYNVEGLKKALATCKELNHDPLGDCINGAIMEYNLHTMRGPGDEGLRPLGDDPFFPCLELSKEDSRVCLFWQPQWWAQPTHYPGVTFSVIFTQMGRWCRSAPSALREPCFEGIGYVAPMSVAYDMQKTIELCQDAASRQHEETLCRAAAASSAFAESTIRTKAMAICEGLPQADKEYCAFYIHAAVVISPKGARPPAL